MMLFYEDKAFIKNINEWLDVSDQAAAKKLDAMKGKFPQMFKQYSSKLYRGMILPGKPVKAFTIDAYTSWSKDVNMAKKFINDPQYRINRKAGQTVLITKTIPSSKIILDIHSLAMFLGVNQMIDLGIDDLAADSALKEQEVLVAKSLTINPADVKVL